MRGSRFLKVVAAAAMIIIAVNAFLLITDTKIRISARLGTGYVLGGDLIFPEEARPREPAEHVTMGYCTYWVGFGIDRVMLPTDRLEDVCPYIAGGGPFHTWQ